MDIRKADVMDKKSGNVCCIKGCENSTLCSYRGQTMKIRFFRFGKYWEYELHFCQEHKDMFLDLPFAEMQKLIDKKKRTRVKPKFCFCGRQATKRLHEFAYFSSIGPWIEHHDVCEKHYRELYVESTEKEVEEFLSGNKDTIRKIHELGQQSMKKIIEEINSGIDKKTEDYIMTEDGRICKVKFDDKKIH